METQQLFITHGNTPAIHNTWKHNILENEQMQAFKPVLSDMCGEDNLLYKLESKVEVLGTTPDGTVMCMRPNGFNTLHS